MAVDANEVAAALQAQGPVEIRETHISWVFLTPERAYKLKKPLVLPFLDYGTPARRREMSAQEIRAESQAGAGPVSRRAQHRAHRIRR